MEVIVVLIVLVVIGIAGFFLYNLAQDTVTRRVKVVSKRMSTTQGANQNMPQTTYHCTFEFEDGQRSEYSVSAGQYALLAEGDRGELDTRGVLFWGFRRSDPGAGLDAGRRIDEGTGHPQVVKVRCPRCRELNDEKAKFCNQCGSAL